MLSITHGSYIELSESKDCKTYGMESEGIEKNKKNNTERSEVRAHMNTIKRRKCHEGKG